MTAALCLVCGNIKYGAYCPCDKCGAPPTGTGFDISFTDHYYTPATLTQFGEVLKCMMRHARDEGIAMAAFMKHLSDYYPEILFAPEVPRQYRSAVFELLNRVVLPDVFVEDGDRIDQVDSELTRNRIRHRAITCKGCGHKQSFALFQRVNTTAAPWVLVEIASGRLFVNTCRKCGQAELIPYETLVIGFEMRYAIWLRIQKCAPEFQIEPPYRDDFADYGDNFKLRVVPAQFELAEKVRIFEDGYDDVQIEFIKLCLRVQRKIDAALPMYYGYKKKGLFGGQKMIFALVGLQGPQEIEFPFGSQQDNLTKIMEKLRPAREKIQPEDDVVDARYLMTLLEASRILIPLSG